MIIIIDILTIFNQSLLDREASCVLHCRPDDQTFDCLYREASCVLHCRPDVQPDF